MKMRPGTASGADSRTGDLSGRAQALVGDSTNHSDSRLMAGDVADLVFTDPYNVDYEGIPKEAKIKGDRRPMSTSNGSSNAFRGCGFAMKPGARCMCATVLPATRISKRAESAGFAVRCQIIWAKNTFAWDSADTSAGTSRCSTATSPARRIPGMATKPSRRCGKKGNPRRIGFIRRPSRLN